MSQTSYYIMVGIILWVQYFDRETSRREELQGPKPTGVRDGRGATFLLYIRFFILQLLGQKHIPRVLLRG